VDCWAERRFEIGKDGVEGLVGSVSCGCENVNDERVEEDYMYA
jgi:hypothetical protein